MSEETTAEDMRFELGRDAALRGDPLHENASEEFRRGYSSSRGFGSNVTPRKFGAGNDSQYHDWVCACGNNNKRYLKRCFVCNLPRASAAEVNA